MSRVIVGLYSCLYACVCGCVVCARHGYCLRQGGSVFFFQAEDGIRDLVRSRGLGDVYKRQLLCSSRIGHRAQ